MGPPELPDRTDCDAKNGVVLLIARPPIAWQLEGRANVKLLKGSRGQTLDWRYS
jgi:hypothetical protein